MCEFLIMNELNERIFIAFILVQPRVTLWIFISMHLSIVPHTLSMSTIPFSLCFFMLSFFYILLLHWILVYVWMKMYLAYGSFAIFAFYQLFYKGKTDLRSLVVTDKGYFRMDPENDYKRGSDSVALHLISGITISSSICCNVWREIEIWAYACLFTLYYTTLHWNMLALYRYMLLRILFCNLFYNFVPIFPFRKQWSDRVSPERWAWYGFVLRKCWANLGTCDGACPDNVQNGNVM